MPHWQERIDGDRALERMHNAHLGATAEKPHYQGITVRQFDPNRDRLDTIQLWLGDKRDLDAKKDSIFLAETGGKIVGVFAMRLIPLVHTCELSHTLIDRRAAEALSLYAEGFTKASGFKEAMFLVGPSNGEMRGFIESKGAVNEGDSSVYTLEVR